VHISSIPCILTIADVMDTCQAEIIKLHHIYIKREFEYKQFLTADRQTWLNGEGVVFKSEDLSLNPGDIKIFFRIFHHRSLDPSLGTCPPMPPITHISYLHLNQKSPCSKPNF
jgi:hypothetical protein